MKNTIMRKICGYLGLNTERENENRENHVFYFNLCGMVMPLSC